MNRLSSLLFMLCISISCTLNAAPNLIEDPSFELTKVPNQFGMPFVKWSGWKFDGDTEFSVGQLGHSGKSSALLVGKSAPKIRIWQEHTLKPGRYRITAFLRGLDIGKGKWGETTELAFNKQYIPLNKNGTFGWTKVVYVTDVTEPIKTNVSFGLLAPGFLWIDDVTLEEVGQDVPLTIKPEIGAEEAPIVAPGPLGSDPVHCSFCGYKNQLAWKTCYACGTSLHIQQSNITKPPLQTIASFKQHNHFDGGDVVDAPFFEDKKALRIDKSYVSLSGTQDWSGYDFLNVELYSDAKTPYPLDIEINDSATRDYWTRVNYSTIAPPGKSTLVLPLKQLYLGEKSRPGPILNLSEVTKFLINIGEKPEAPVFLGRVWLERDDSLKKVQFDGLYAFNFGIGNSPTMEGFTLISPATLYSKGRGYGLKNATVWRTYDAFQPDPLYKNYMCIESGGFAVDLPNGKYRVFMNIDNPSGYWGEYQSYKNRAVFAQGKEVINESMDFNTLKNKYFRYWNTEDLPTDNTFDKYQKLYFQEKIMDVDVTDGQLYLEFKGQNVANSVSTVIIYPLDKLSQGEKFLKWVENKRRFYFDNYFKRVLHTPSGDALQPSAADSKRGYVVFQRDVMQDVYYNDRPLKEEIDKPLKADSFADQIEFLSFSLLPVQNLGQVKISVSALEGPEGTIPAHAIDIGYVSNRISRVTMEGSIYTISPRLIMPSNTVDMPKDITRRFWLTIRTPLEAKPGIYQGHVMIDVEHGKATTLPITLRVRKGILDPVDIPVGPFGYTISMPWDEKDKDAQAFTRDMAFKGLLKLREYGFTLFSGMPTLSYKIENGKQIIDYEEADAQMQLAKNLGFLAVNTYGSGLKGLNAYYQDNEQMNNAKISDYSAFIQVIYEAIQQHAIAHDWLPVYWNLADEPLGDDLVRSIQNAQSYKDAFPKGPPYFTGASSYKGNNQNDPHFKLAKAFHVATLNGHDETGIRLLQQQGTDWAFYNNSSRWTFGEYLYKAAKQFGMKFRLAWHWNNSAGDPYYALDSREDDYAWFHATPTGQLIPEVSFMRLAMGLVDYRMLVTLQRLIHEKQGTPAALAAEKLMDTRLNAFKLGQTNHEMIYPNEDWESFRSKIADAIESLR